MLEEDDVKKGTNWTIKWDLDDFCKKMSFIPIRNEFHWSLCIVCNAENVDSSLPFFRFFTVPKQPNFCDCGVYICQDALSMFNLHFFIHI
jgi:Ulp1 family protease